MDPYDSLRRPLSGGPDRLTGGRRDHAGAKVATAQVRHDLWDRGDGGRRVVMQEDDLTVPSATQVVFDDLIAVFVAVFLGENKTRADCLFFFRSWVGDRCVSVCAPTRAGVHSRSHGGTLLGRGFAQIQSLR